MGVSTVPATSEIRTGKEAARHARTGLAYLKTLFVAHAVTTLLDESADGIEARLTGSTPRPDSGRQTSGLHRKHLRGEHAAEPERLRKLLKLLDTRAPPKNKGASAVLRLEYDALLWRWLVVLPPRWKLIYPHLRDLPDDLYWSTHGHLVPFGGRLGSALLPRPKIEVLVASGRADAVALLALGATLLKCQNPNQGWFEALRAVPVALAVWARRPGVIKVVHFVFAALRKLALDDVRWNSQRIDYGAVDLAALIEQVPDGWPSPIIFDRKKERFGRGPTPLEPSEDELAWIRGSLAPVVETPPAALWPTHRWPVDHAEALQLHPHLKDRLHAWFGGYWAPSIRGHDRLRDMTDQLPVIPW